MLILREITMAHTFTEGGRIVKLGDPDLFKFPIAYLCEAGYWTMTDEEVAQVRAYVLKGGFLIFDDFGRGDWINLNEQMNRVLPGVQFIPLTLDHPIFHTFFDVRSLDLQSYRGQAQFYGVYENNDPQGRLLAVVNYNADIGEFFQYSDTGWMPVDMSNEAFKLGVNYWIYALSR